MSDWIIPEGHDPLDYHSFIYRLTMPTGEFYIGKKGIWSLKAKRIHRESGWRDYWSSSDQVADLVTLHGKSRVTREITTFCVSAGEASWQELVALVGGVAPAILDPRCLNRNVLMAFNRKVLSGYLDDGRRQKYLDDIAKQKRAAGLSKV